MFDRCVVVLKAANLLQVDHRFRGVRAHASEYLSVKSPRARPFDGPRIQPCWDDATASERLRAPAIWTAVTPAMMMPAPSA
jgi:hypothetical protein